LIDKNERLSIDLGINFDILEELYYSNITKRGLYKIYNQEIGSYYALKVYDVNMNDIQDIEKEIISYNKNANKINFPKIHYKFQKDNLICVVMDWIDGKTATNTFKTPSKDGFEIKQRINYCIEICLIMQKIHQHRIIHRDLKPDNILITNLKDARGGVSIIDFGLSALKRNLKGEGTPIFQSPEQELGIGIIGTWSDIYALGHVFYYILHSNNLLLVPNDDYNGWFDFQLDELICQYDITVYEKIFKGMLEFNSKNRTNNLSGIINDLKNLQRSIK
jgi:serine/threonine-protein kinase